MFCYQPNFFSQCEIMTAERFAQLVVSDAVVNRIKDYREQLPMLDRLKAEIKSRETLLEARSAQGDAFLRSEGAQALRGGLAKKLINSRPL